MTTKVVKANGILERLAQALGYDPNLILSIDLSLKWDEIGTITIRQFTSEAIESVAWDSVFLELKETSIQ